MKETFSSASLVLFSLSLVNLPSLVSLPFDLLPRLDPLPTPPPPSSSRCLALLPEEFSLRIRSTRKRKKSSFSFCCPNRSQSRPNYQKFSAVRAEQEKDPLIADALALVLSLTLNNPFHNNPFTPPQDRFRFPGKRFHLNPPIYTAFRPFHRILSPPKREK